MVDIILRENIDESGASRAVTMTSEIGDETCRARGTSDTSTAEPATGICAAFDLTVENRRQRDGSSSAQIRDHVESAVSILTTSA